MGYHPKAVRGLGWSLITLGSLSVLLGLAADINFAARGAGTLGHFISAPIWSGLLVLTTGILGVYSAKKPTNRCLVIAFMILSIFVILACICCIALAGLGITLHNYVHNCHQYDWEAYHEAQRRYEEAHPTDKYGPGSPDLWSYETYDCSAGAIGLHATNILLAVAEMVLGFVVSIMSCCGMCTWRRRAGQTVIYTAAPMAGSEQGNIVFLQGAPGQVPQGAQQQVFVAQHPGAAGGPVQVLYPAQVLPAYQVSPGAVPGVQDEKKSPIPADSV